MQDAELRSLWEAQEVANAQHEQYMADGPYGGVVAGAHPDEGGEKMY